MLRVTDQYIWNIVFALFFLVMVVMGVIILDSEARIAYADLQPVDFILMTLAGWRLTRLFVYDVITKFVREQFWDVREVGKRLELVKPERGPRRTLADLMGCPWCLGMWATASVAFFYLLTPYAVFPVIILALSAVASFLQILGNLVGHKAEQLKNENGG